MLCFKQFSLTSEAQSSYGGRDPNGVTNGSMINPDGLAAGSGMDDNGLAAGVCIDPNGGSCPSHAGGLLAAGSGMDGNGNS